MAARPKYIEVMSIIKRRIREGDYLLGSIPGERRIAEETGVSYMTARRAVQSLLEERVLMRHASGALEVHPDYTSQINPAEIVLLYPAYPSSYLTQLRVLVVEAARQRGVTLRPGQFLHWDEQTVMDAVTQAKGALIIPHGPEIPARLVRLFRAHKVAILDGDFTSDGLPSIRLFTDRCIRRVLNHLRQLGHRQIDCLNTQNRNPEVDRRISIWQQWLVARSVHGVLHDDPAPLFTDPTRGAYRLMTPLLAEHRFRATAVIGTTCPAAIGAIRACYEQGVEVGRTVSIAAVNLEPPAEYFCPSITGLHTPDLSQVLAQCFDWFASESSWRGPLLLEPSDSSLFRGESTAPPAARSGVRGVQHPVTPGGDPDTRGEPG